MAALLDFDARILACLSGSAESLLLGAGGEDTRCSDEKNPPLIGAGPGERGVIHLTSLHGRAAAQEPRCSATQRRDCASAFF